MHVGGHVLLNDSEFLGNTGKLKTRWLGPYAVIKIAEGGTIQLEKLDGTPLKGLVNGSRINLYQDRHALVNLVANNVLVEEK